MTARALAATLAIAGAAHAETRPGYGGEVIGATLGEPATLDPVAIRSPAETAVAGLVYDTLYRCLADGTIVPHLALELPTVDGQTARIRVRTVARHDGGTLGPGDVAASLERLRASGAGWLLAGVGKIGVEGDAVLLSLPHPIPDLAARLATPPSAIVPAGRPGTASSAIGSGPFALVRVDRRGRRVILRAFDQHFAGRPYVDQIELGWFLAADAEVRRYEVGSAHLSLRGATTFIGHQPKYKNSEVEGPGTMLVYVGFGRAHPAALGSRDLRRALSLAIPRGGFTAVGTGERVVPAAGPLPVELGGVAAADRDKHGDLDAARTALRAAQGKVPELAPASLGKLELEILVDAGRPDDREVAERVLLALDKLGIAARITAVGAVDLAERVAAGKCDLYVGVLPAVSAEPALLWAAAFAAGGDGWARAALDKGALDKTAAAREFAARLPIVPLYHRGLRVSHRADLRNLAVDMTSRLGLADAFFHGAPERARK